MRFVEHDSVYDPMYVRFASKVGGASLTKPFSYYGRSDTIVVRRHLLIDDAVNPPVVIGAVSIKVQDYVIAGKSVRVAVATYPIALGVAQSKYALAGTLIFRKLLDAYPLNIFGTGAPGKTTVANLCSMLGWHLIPVPYLFMPLRLAPLAAKQFARFASAARIAGKIGLFTPLESVLRASAAKNATDIDLANVAAFDIELDQWWSIYSTEIGFGLARDSRQLNAMFPTEIGAFQRFVFRRNGRMIGFAVLLVPEPELAVRTLGANVVTLVEFCVLATDLEDAAVVLAKYLRRQRIDAVIANHSHGKTVEALEAAGFWARSTNMYLAVSPQLQSRLDDARVPPSGMLITRADCDGPIGLGVDF